MIKLDFIFNKLRQKSALFRRLVPESIEQTPEDLQNRVKDAADLADALTHRGVEVYLQRLAADEERAKNGLAAMESAEFAGPRGLDQKGFITGIQHAQKAVAQILAAGKDAERKLAVLAERAKTGGGTVFRT